MLYILLIFIFIRPFISSLAYPYENSIYSTLLFCLLLIWAIPLTFILSPEGREKGEGFIYTFLYHKKIKYPIILFLVSLISSVIISRDKINSLSEIYKYITGLLIFFIAASLPNKDKTKVLHTIILSGLIIGLLAIYQYFFGFKHLVKYITDKNITDTFITDYIKQKRVFYPFVTPNILAGFLILIIPLVLIIKAKIKWFILFLLLFALFLTKSLGAILSLFLGFILFLGFTMTHQGKKTRNSPPHQFKLYLASLLFLGTISIILIFLLRQISANDQFLPLFSIGQRLKYWRDTLAIIKSHPILGIGLGNFNLPNSRYAHNLYLQIWAEMGILGLFSFSWLIRMFFRNAFKNIKSHNVEYSIVMLTTSYSIFLIHNFIDFTFFLPEVSYIFWITISYLFFLRL